MKIDRKNALKLWDECFGDVRFAEDFHGYLMCRDAYGNDDFFIKEDSDRIYCGWNIHHILPIQRQRICKATFVKMNSVTLVGWFLQYANRLEVLSPDSLRNAIVTELSDALKKYQL